MRRDIKDLWVAALRSGEFQQGKGKLDDKGHFCALGVLSTIGLCQGICTWSEGGSYDGRKQSLSYNLMVWAGVAQKDEKYLERGSGFVKFQYKGKLTSIAELNDSGKSFKEIANIIEKHWREL